MKQRIEKLQNSLLDGEAALIFSLSNRFYLTNFCSSAGVIAITRKKAVLLIDFRYFEKAKQVVNTMEVELCTNTYKQVAEFLKAHKIKKVFIETDEVKFSLFAGLKAELEGIEISEECKVQDIIKNLRAVKSADEIGLIKSAQQITDEAFSYILERIGIGKTEKEIALDLEFFMRKNGAEGVAFGLITVSGKNSSLPHGAPSDKKLEKGDFLTMDFGAKVGGYRSDMTRTVALSSVSEKEKLVYDTVLKAQLLALDSIKEGAVCKDIDAIARNFINESGFQGCFGHGLGHSIGIDNHESPSFNTRDTTVLKSGMVLTVEPGIYLENEFGVRIEDMVVVTENGYENLTKSPKEFIII